MISKHSDKITDRDVLIDFEKSTVVVKREITARALYSYTKDVCNELCNMGYTVPMGASYACPSCGDFGWYMKPGWTIIGEHFVKNELTGETVGRIHIETF